MPYTGIDEGEAREEDWHSSDESAEYEENEAYKDEEEGLLHHAYLREIIVYGETDAVVALAYLDLRISRYWESQTRQNNESKYWGIVRRALAANPPNIEDLTRCHNATAAVRMSDDLDLARSWAATFGSTVLSCLLSSQQGPANLRSLGMGQPDIMYMLVNAGEMDTALCWAALRPTNTMQRVFACLVANYNFDPTYVLVDVMSRPSTRIAIQVILNLGVDSGCFDATKNAALCAECANNEYAISQLISGGADVCHTDAAGNTALHFAARAGRTSTVKELIDSGAVASQVNNVGRTALHEAVIMGRHMTVQNLLENGSNVNETDWNGQTALHLAFQGPRATRSLVLHVLLEYHASIHLQDNNGRTVLHYAAAEHPNDTTDTNIVKLLVDACREDPKHSLLPVTTLSAKEVINIRDGNGRTALYEAKMARNIDIYKLLVDTGGDPFVQPDEV